MQSTLMHYAFLAFLTFHSILRDTSPSKSKYLVHIFYIIQIEWYNIKYKQVTTTKV